MQTTMVHLSKGGVGKTTTAILYAWYLRKLDKRVLFVDFDNQGNSSKVLTTVDPGTFGQYHANTIGTILDFTSQSFPEMFDAVEKTEFDIIASVDDVQFDSNDAELMMQSVFHLLESDAYDIAIFDTTPVVDMQLVALMKSADNLIIPMRPDEFSFDQISVVKELMKIADSDRTEPLKIAGIIVNGMMKKPAMTAARDLTLAGYPDDAIEIAIDMSEPVRLAIDNSIPLFTMSNSWARAKRNEAEQVFEEIVRRSTWRK